MELPEPNTKYKDRKIAGRTLVVKEVVPGDKLGREIRGTLASLDDFENGRDYACDQAIFGKVWEKA